MEGGMACFETGDVIILLNALRYLSEAAVPAPITIGFPLTSSPYLEDSRMWFPTAGQVRRVVKRNCEV